MKPRLLHDNSPRPMPAPMIRVARRQVFRSLSYLRLRGRPVDLTHYNISAVAAARLWADIRTWPIVGRRLGYR